MKKIIKVKYTLLVLIIEISILILALILAYNSLTMPKKKSTFFIPSSNINTILDTLDKHGFYTYAIDKYVFKFMTLPKKGWYTIGQKKESRIKFFYTLHTKRSETMQVKLYAGETSHELTKRLANDMKLDPDKLLNAYKKRSQFKEADIFSGRYTLARDADENTTIAYLFHISNDILKNFSQNYCKKVPTYFELKTLIVMASIIQKESNSVKEMPLISSVIYNRLEKGMKLQMDGTLNYGRYAHTIVTPERIKKDESLYNTYKHKGLPPAPLSTISIEALEAAYNPKSSNYLFFMLNKDGSHNFAVTYAEHLENIRAFRATSKENNETKKDNINSTKPSE